MTFRKLFWKKLWTYQFSLFCQNALYPTRRSTAKCAISIKIQNVSIFMIWYTGKYHLSYILCWRVLFYIFLIFLLPIWHRQVFVETGLGSGIKEPLKKSCTHGLGCLGLADFLITTFKPILTIHQWHHMSVLNCLDKVVTKERQGYIKYVQQIMHLDNENLHYAWFQLFQFF